VIILSEDGVWGWGGHNTITGVGAYYYGQGIILFKTCITIAMMPGACVRRDQPRRALIQDKYMDKASYLYSRFNHDLNYNVKAAFQLNAEFCHQNEHANT
jgi:hypothetical protein